MIKKLEPMTADKPLLYIEEMFDKLNLLISSHNELEKELNKTTKWLNALQNKVECLEKRLEKLEARPQNPDWERIVQVGSPGIQVNPDNCNHHFVVKGQIRGCMYCRIQIAF